MSSIKKVSGELGALGAGEATTIDNSKAEDVGAETYAYFRIDNPDGSSQVLENVAARRQTAAFVAIGFKGDFYFVEGRLKRKRTHMLVALSDGTHHVADAGAMDWLIKSLRRIVLLYFFASLCLIILGLALSFFIIGLVPLALGLYALYKTWQMRKIWAQAPNSAAIADYLKTAGFPVNPAQT